MAMSVSLSFAQRPQMAKEPFAINLDKLSQCLQLEAYQQGKVAAINAAFAQSQQENRFARIPRHAKDKQVRQLYATHLQSMREVLTNDQLRTYTTILNATYNNQQLQNQELRTNRYLAERRTIDRE